MKKIASLIVFATICSVFANKVDAATVFDKKITLYEKVVLYKEPKDNQKMNDSIAPQSVQAIEKSDNWIKIQTWLGPKWIKTISYNIGLPIDVSKKVTLKSNTYLYQKPLDNAKTFSVLGPQTVLSYQEIDGWYLIDTWKGPMWIKPSNADVKEYKEELYVSSLTTLYNQSALNSSTGTKIAPQIVTANGKKGDWYQIQTWMGPKWIQPVNPITGVIKNEAQSIKLKDEIFLYTLPFEKKKTGTLIAPQTVNSIRYWINSENETWYQIKTWKGDMWIKEDDFLPSRIEINSGRDIDKNLVKVFEVKGKGKPLLQTTISLKDRNKKIIQKDITSDKEGNFFTTMDTSSLEDGEITLQVTQNDPKGKVITPGIVTVKKDLTPPVTALSVSPIITFNNQKEFELTGKTEGNSAMQFKITDEDDKHIYYSTISPVDGNFYIPMDLSSLKNGHITIKFHSMDVYRNIEEEKTMVIQKDDTYYQVNQAERKKWNIFNDGTHPIETTKGIKDMLSWVKTKGLKTVKMEEGTYLIKKADPTLWRDPSACINMIPNITFELDDKAIIQKETNAKESYETMCIGYGADNVTLKGGTYKGDKDTHDYSQKEDSSTPGTHENGIGISISGAKNLTIDGVKAINFTGDGLGIGGKGTLIQDLYDASFESGAIDTNGQLIADSSKIRMKSSISLSNDRYKDTIKKEPYFELSNAVGIPGIYDVYFYKADGSFLSSYSVKKWRELVQIPQGAESFKAVFTKSSTTNSYVEFWNKALATNVVVKNSEFAFNRRQGITIGGGDHITIINNILHDMKGTAPQSGIDVEGGYGENGMLNKNISIQKNEFYNNAAYDLILYDGHDATVEENHFASKGTFGLAVSSPFKTALVKDNHFDGTRIIASHDVQFLGNKMNDSLTTIDGPNITFDGMEFTNSSFSVSPTTPNGVEIKNITTYNSTISVWNNPIHLSNITMYGPTAGITGSALGNVIDNLKIYNYSLGGMSLSPGSYTNCVLESAIGTIPSAASGLNLNQSGTYMFDGCQIKTSGNGFIINNKNTDVSILNSSIQSSSMTSVLSATNLTRLRLENNDIQSTGITYGTNGIVVIGDYWKRNTAYADNLPDVTIVNNAITNTSTTNVNGLITTYAGIGAPVYTIDDNVFTNTQVLLKGNDTNLNNVFIKK